MRKKSLVEIPDLFDWQMELAGRENRVQLPGWNLKLDKRMAGIAAYQTNEVTTDAKKMTATGILSTPRMDQSRDIVMGLGIDTEIHRRNPLVLLMHQPTSPIGRAEDENGNYTVMTGEERTYCTTSFFKNSLEGEQAFRLVEMKALPGMSVGIRPKPRMAKSRADAQGNSFCVIEGCHLIEASHVFFPDNPECLIVAVQKGLGGKPLVKSLKEMFMSLLPETAPVVTSGFDYLGELKAKSAEELTSAQQDILKASPEVQACVSHKIPILRRENPSWEMDRVEAAAYSICGEKKKQSGEAPPAPQGPPMVPHGHAHDDQDYTGEDDARPLGAQYMAAMHEMVLAMNEFMDENEKRLEPEVAKELEDLHTHLANMMNYTNEKYCKRYPDLPALIHKVEDDMEEDKKTLDDITRNRRQARTYVRKFWTERMKKLKTSDHEVVAEAARFLQEVASGPKEITRTTKAAAIHHSRELKKIKANIAEQEDTSSSDIERLNAVLAQRKESLKAI